MPQRNKTEGKRTGSAFDIPVDPITAGVADLPIAFPEYLLAIDPGTRHCGMASFARDEEGWHLNSTSDVLPIDCVTETKDWLTALRTSEKLGQLVVEGYQLYPGKLQEQGMSRMGTPEIIGALKWVFIESRDDGFEGWFKEQGASVKSSGVRFMEENGIAITGSNVHKRDAEAHGWYRIKVLNGQMAKQLRFAAKSIT